jgi:gamma-glutamyltranspeptidase/glutathione hydrolase
VVHSTKGIVACTQPLAAKCGIDILNAGGNAAVSHIIVATMDSRVGVKLTKALS